MLKTLFIVSGGKNIGSGHINRCELLSNELKEKNFLFIGIKKQKFDKIKNNLNYEIQRFNKKSIKKILDVCKKYNINRVILDHTNTNLLIQKALFNKYFLVIFDNQQKISFMSDVLINANRMELLKELWLFLRLRKKLWLAPIIIVMLILGGLLILAQGSVVAPFIYTLF